MNPWFCTWSSEVGHRGSQLCLSQFFCTGGKVPQVHKIAAKMSGGQKAHLYTFLLKKQLLEPRSLAKKLDFEARLHSVNVATNFEASTCYILLPHLYYSSSAWNCSSLGRCFSQRLAWYLRVLIQGAAHGALFCVHLFSAGICFIVQTIGICFGSFHCLCRFEGTSLSVESVTGHSCIQELVIRQMV